MNNMKRIFLFLLFLPILCLNAQNRVLKGKLIDKNTREPVAWALIYTSDSLNTAESGLEGHFRLSSPAGGSVNIHVSAFPDYKDTLIEGIDPDHFKKKLFLIRLTPEDISTIPSAGSEECPFCKSQKDAVPIVYGEQTFEMIAMQQKKQLVFAGCCHYPSYPLWYCKKCKIKY
jgi:hypothetical protein